MPPEPAPTASLAVLDDAGLAARVAQEDHAAFETLMRRHNGRLFRVARAILKDDAEAEDALQDAYLAPIGTRIVVNQALMRLRRRKRDRVVVPFGPWHTTERDMESRQVEADVADESTESPPSAALRAELRRLLERKIDDLPAAFRAVFVMRDVEDMSVQETADCLSVPAATVRTRLFRARALLREALARDLDAATVDVFAFAGERCDRIVAGVLGRVRASPVAGGT